MQPRTPYAPRLGERFIGTITRPAVPNNREVFWDVWFQKAHGLYRLISQSGAVGRERSANRRGSIDADLWVQVERFILRDTDPSVSPNAT